MKQVWTVFVFFWYIYGIDRLLLTSAVSRIKRAAECDEYSKSWILAMTLWRKFLSGTSVLRSLTSHQQDGIQSKNTYQTSLLRFPRMRRKLGLRTLTDQEALVKEQERFKDQGIAEQPNKVKTLDLSAREKDNITCGDHAVIRIENATVYAHGSYCASNTSNACNLSDDDFKSIETRCNDTHTCTVDFPTSTSCLKEDRYFNLSYSCLAPTNLFCTFEFSFCYWKNMLSDGLQWKRYSTNRSSPTVSDIPTMDHTTKSQNGFYIYMRQNKSAKTGKLKSRMLSFDIEKCLVLRYRMNKTSALTIYRNSSMSTLFRPTVNDTDNFWSVASIPLCKGNSSEIVIEGMVSGNAYIAIDDIDIQDWDCNHSNEYFPLSCNFEADLCSFEIQPKFGLNWKRSAARAAARAAVGGQPSVDHTNDRYGFYVYSQSLNHPITPRRRIIISFDNDLDERCLTLWYYMYGKEPGHLYIYIQMNKTEEILSYIIDTRTTAWSQFQANVYNATQIILEYNFTSDSHGGIALDDIYISPIICSVEEPFSHECIKKDKQLHMDCPVSDVLIEAIAFDQNISMSCRNTTEQIENNLNEIFGKCKDTATCAFTPADLIDDECFDISKRLQLMYSCIAPPYPEPDNNLTISTLPQTDEMSTAVMKRTQTAMQQTDDTMFFTTMDKQTISTSEHTGDIADSGQPSSPTPVIGIVVGVVLSLIALSVFLVIAVIYFKRYRYAEKKGHSIVANEDSHSDYTGHQNIAFSPEVNVTTQTDYCEIRKSKLNEHYHDISDTFSPSINATNDDEYSEIANVINSPNSNSNSSTNYQPQYITLDPNATGFNRSNPQTNLNNESKNNHNSNETTSLTGGDDYAILDPDDLNESKNNTPKVLPLSDNYVVLDPNETGFNRKENMDRVLATPTVTSEDPYDFSKDETYDTSSNSRHKEQENNIYSHTVDNVYDIAGNQKKKEENDGTYDHFFGQKSEDDYDISKPI